MLWDIFCKVIDNYGDIGVCWRLAHQIAARGERARLWVDDASALAWMAPGQTAGVEVRPWQGTPPEGLPPGNVLIEAFGCDIPPAWVTAVADAHTTAWINLEYLSAEPYVERMHGLPSPVLTGALAGRSKRFFYPGFTPKTGGLPREPDLLDRQQRFDRTAWLAAQGIEQEREQQLISLFCYEPAALPELLDQLARQDAPTRTQLLVTAGRAASAVQAAMPAHTPSSRLRIHYLPRLSQDDYDHLLWACDLNFVRGEDSLVRALWAARPDRATPLQSVPFIWHIYPQDDDAHHAKLCAFLDWMPAPDSGAVTLRAFHEIWNGLRAAPLPSIDLTVWGEAAQQARMRLLNQSDLLTQLQTMARAR